MNPESKLASLKDKILQEVQAIKVEKPKKKEEVVETSAKKIKGEKKYGKKK